MDKIVSVVIPSYGGSEFLHRCIDSVLTQTYKNIEVIVVDDNGLGTENQLLTAEIMGKYAGDNRVKYVCHEVNINGSAARNTGVKNSSGEYIALMDDDDEFYPHKIERQVRLLDSLTEEYGLVYCSCDIYKGDMKVGVSHADKSGSLMYECMMHQVQIPSTSLLIRKKDYEAIGGFDESFKRHQDWEFVDRFAKKFLIKGDDFIGFKRNLEFRNKLGTPEIYKERRLYYLNKMMPLIKSLPVNQQKDIIIRNKMDIVLAFLKSQRFKEAFFEYFDAKPGVRGLKFIYERIKTILKRGKLTIV